MLDLRLDKLENERQRVVDYARAWDSRNESSGRMVTVLDRWATHSTRHAHALLTRQAQGAHPPPLLRQSPADTAAPDYTANQSRNMVEWMPEAAPTSGDPARQLDFTPREYPEKNKFIFAAVSELLTLLPEAWATAFGAWNRRRALIVARLDSQVTNASKRKDWLSTVTSAVSGYHFLVSDNQRMP